jgi:hypothetical protein
MFAKDGGSLQAARVKSVITNVTIMTFGTAMSKLKSVDFI